MHIPDNALLLTELHTIEIAFHYIHASGLISFVLQAFAGLTPLDQYSSYGCYLKTLLCPLNNDFNLGPKAPEF